MAVKERLKSYLKSKKISERDFATSIEVSSGYVSAISKSIQPDKLKRISMQFPDLNISWLMNGEGQMLKENSGNVIENVILGNDNYTTSENGNATGEVSVLIKLLENKDLQITEVIGLIKNKDFQINKTFEMIDSKDKQIDRLLAIIETKKR